VGFGDDLLYVRLNGNVVFDGGWVPLSNDQSLHETYPLEWSPTLEKASASMKGSKYNGRLHKGAWFDVSQGDIVQLDVLIGDWGGECGYFLLLEKEGAKYDMAPDNVTPKLPFFQVGAKLPLPPPPGQEAPPVSDSDVVWPSVSDM